VRSHLRAALDERVPSPTVLSCDTASLQLYLPSITCLETPTEETVNYRTSLRHQLGVDGHNELPQAPRRYHHNISRSPGLSTASQAIILAYEEENIVPCHLRLSRNGITYHL
jgi:hypothetical protein